MPRGADSGSLRDRLLFGPVPGRVVAAREVLGRQGEALRADAALAAALSELGARGRELAEVMTAQGLGATCALCGQGPTGGCCSAVMLEEVDGPLLLMNALGGRGIPTLREDDFECGFLGSRGCVLEPKPIFCLSYLCRQLRAELTRVELDELERATDALLLAQTAVEALLLARIASH